jgi:Tol biopolymer transport system component
MLIKKHISFLPLVIVLGLLVVVACTSESDGEYDLVAYTSNDAGNNDVYLIRSDGKKRTQITDADAEDMHAAISPDGSRIAFASNRNGNFDIFVVDEDGGNLEQITRDEAPELSPKWSPNGQKIAYLITGASENAIAVYDFVTNETKKMSGGEGFSAYQHSWAPDGESIIFIRGQKRSDGDIYSVDIDSGNLSEIIVSNTLESLPSISPDGSRIVYTNVVERFVDIWVSNIDGSEQTRLTNDRFFDSEPIWSPDGSKLAWTSLRVDDLRQQVFLMNPDGSDQKRLTTSGMEDFQIAWSPDGTKIYFVRLMDGQSEIFTIDIETGAEVRITESSGHEQVPNAASAQ